MKLHFNQPNNLSQLHDEILAQCPAVAPINGIAQMLVEGDNSNVWLTLHDDLSLEVQQQIAAIVAAHTPEPQTEPDWAQFRSQMSNHSAYVRVVTGHAYNNVLNSLLIPLLWQVGENKQLLGEVTHLWNMMIVNVPLTESEISELNTIASVCNLPLQLTAAGAMEVT